jgi:hypothetical protein
MYAVYNLWSYNASELVDMTTRPVSTLIPLSHINVPAA